ncbi:hypothetical protein [Lysinibacillus sphaericus]|uniref:Uncharacterized protein n=1 Tax=Lysinibacillus sphaericus OT4b.31 TaxID=1285586 RepID=R7Z8V0_LYSSH|nr:hypothetical protein [Lysinibacillus sphaericus]EON70454.1 hypothetical protein H131_21257 [Lysinibacillus sphaericus OT4b.31]
MDIVFSDENRNEILHAPIIPVELEVSFPHNNQVVSTINGGDINLIGQAGLKSLTFSSWFPIREYSFVKSKVLAPEAKEYFVKWKRQRKPIRVVITSKGGWEIHNELYTIEEFNFGYDRVGDMTYTLKLTQFVRKQVKK